MEKTRRRLGRGLEALLGPATVDEAKSNGTLAEIPLASIDPNPYQPRRQFDPAALEELQNSLATSGLLQPVVVRPVAENRYELVAGERRCRAAEALGWTNIGAVVRDLDDRTLLTLALVENLQRDALSAIEEALGYQRLIDEFGVTQSDVAELVSRDRSTVANALRLLRLPDSVQRLVHEGKLSTGHARALLQLADQHASAAMAERVVTEGLSVREVEAFARKHRPSKRRPRGGDARDPHVRRVEDALRLHLGTDVFVAMRGKESGRMTVNFYSNDDLARILEIVFGKPYEG